MLADLGQFIWPDVAQGRQPQFRAAVNTRWPWIHMWCGSFGFPDIISGEYSGQAANNVITTAQQNGIAFLTPNNVVYDVYFLNRTAGVTLALPTSAVTLVICGCSLNTATEADIGSSSTTLTDRLGGHFPYSDGNIYWDFGGTTAGLTRLFAACGTVQQSDVMVLTAGPRGMEIWRNGALLASQANAPSRTNQVGGAWGLGMHGSSGSVNNAAAAWSFIGMIDGQIDAASAQRMSRSHAAVYAEAFAAPTLPFAAGITGTISRPGSDIAVSGWTFTGASLSASINEATRNDASYAEAPFSASGAITTLEDGAGNAMPLAPGTYNLSFAGDYLTAAAASCQFRFSALDSSNAVLGVSPWQATTSSVAQYTVPLTVAGGTATRLKIEIQA
jgi:hypothetical protein